MGFPWQEYWRGLPFPSPGDLPNPGIKPLSPVSPALTGRFFTTEPPGKPAFFVYSWLNMKKKNYCKRDVISNTYCFKKDFVGKEYRKNENGLICKDSTTLGEFFAFDIIYQWYHEKYNEFWQYFNVMFKILCSKKDTVLFLFKSFWCLAFLLDINLQKSIWWQLLKFSSCLVFSVFLGRRRYRNGSDLPSKVAPGQSCSKHGV